MNHRVTCCDLNGHNCDEGRKCPYRQVDPMQSRVVIALAILCVVVAVCAAVWGK